MLYSFATMAGIFCVPGVLGTMAADPDVWRTIQGVILLPVITLLISTGMYILNDLVDADLDRANGKKRPIPSGQVSKKQAWIFIVSTNGLAIVFSAFTYNSASMLIVISMMAIGIMYSAPRIALMNRFVVKTLSISIFYALCALVGIVSSHGMALAFENPAVPIYSMVLLGIMIFISSVLNDLGDIDGDRAAKRRTIPVVIGAKKTMKLLSFLAAATIAIAVLAFPVVGPISVAMSIGFFLLLQLRLRKILQGLVRMDKELIRKQHKKIFPMHMLLQLLLAVGTIQIL